MDFSKLAVTETRRNPTRTVVGIVTCALAAMIVVLLRVVPEGYNVGVALPERTFSGGDILIFPAQAPLSSSETNMLIWRNWHGSDWQSHLLYYFPDAATKGYLAEEACAGWRGMIPRDIIQQIANIPNVKRVSAYRSLPCVITTDHGTTLAFLRGFDLEGHPIEPHLTQDADKYPPFAQGDLPEVVVPNRGRPFSNLKIGDAVSITVPKPIVYRSGSPAGFVPQLAVDWNGAQQYSFAVSQKYAIQVGEEVDLEAPRDSGGPPPTIPVYWERQELLVPMKVFEKILKELGSVPATYGSGDFDLDFPTYQIAVTVDRSAKLRETTRLIREALGSDYGVYPVAEARGYQTSHVVMPPDMHSVYSSLIIGFASVVVAGNIYITIAQQKRKLGLLRVVGATSGNIIQYILTLVAYVSAAGTFFGIVAGNLLYLITLIGSDLTFREWLSQALGDCGKIMGLSIGLSLAIGFGIAWWASRLSCAEVLSRE
jgi:hypothetical protein